MGNTFKGLIDTGSAVSLISDEVAHFLKANGVVPTEVPGRIALADKTIIPTNDAYTFALSFQGSGKPISVWFIHLKSLTVPILLGMDLIKIGNLVTINTVSEALIVDSVPLSQNQNVDSLSEETQREVLACMLSRELAKFDKVSGRTHVVEHTIKLKDETPIKQRYYPRNPKMQEVINEEVDRMLKEGVIEESSSPWSSPVVLVKKTTGAYRFCIDFRRLNQATERDAYPLPQINFIIEKLKEARFISTLDLKQGYWQVPLSVESRPLTAFTVPGKGLYQFVVMPFGLHSAGASFQRLLDKIIGPELEPKAFAYLDDLIIVSKTFEEHLEILREVFERLRRAGLKINPEKCHFGKRELRYLGHIVSEAGIKTDPEKVKAIRDFPTPNTVRKLRSFLGLASWYRRFVDNFAKLTVPLTKLLRKDSKWNWAEDQHKAFESLKDRLTSTPVLSCPDFSKPFCLQVDASGEGLGAALTQKFNNREHVIAYASRLLSDGERKFTVTEQECLALVWAVKKFRPYIEGYHFVAITDHAALKWLMNLQQPSGRLARWVLDLQQYDFEIQYRKGTLNKVADALSRNPIEEGYHPCAYSELTSSAKEVDWYERTINRVKKKPQNFKQFTIEGDELKVRRSHRKNCEIDDTLIWKCCVPDRMKQTVLEENHDLQTAGHLGIRKTIKRIQQRYYWPKMANDIRKYVRRCKTCQAYKLQQAKPAGKMHFRSPTGPWYSITADLMGPFPRSKKGSKFLLVMQDTYTKWLEVAPLKAATAKLVANEFRDRILLRYGAPESIITDNGSQFTARIWYDLIKGWNVEQQFTAPYSPQGNPVERSNRTVKTMIAQYIKDDHTLWDVYLKELCYAYNTSVHDTTGYTPALLNFGRELRIPNAAHGPLKVAGVRESPSLSAEVKSRLEKLSAIFEKCRKNMKRASESQTKYYNLRRREVSYKVDDKVWLRQHPLSSAAESFAAKLAAKYDGPYTIMSKVGANIYQLQSDSSRTIVRAHVKDLKRYVT